MGKNIKRLYRQKAFDSAQPTAAVVRVEDDHLWVDQRDVLVPASLQKAKPTLSSMRSF